MNNEPTPTPRTDAEVNSTKGQCDTSAFISLREFANTIEQENKVLRQALTDGNKLIESACNEASGFASEISKLKSEVEQFRQAREVLHKKFGFVPHPDDPKKCHCAYCARDFEAVADHAAEMEMICHSKDNERDELSQKLAEVERDNALIRQANSDANKLIESAANEAAGFAKQLSTAEQIICEMREALSGLLDPEYLHALGSSEDSEQSVVHGFQTAANKAIALSAPIAGKWVRKGEE